MCQVRPKKLYQRPAESSDIYFNQTKEKDY